MSTKLIEPNSISLTQEQIEFIIAHANMVAPMARQQFLTAVEGMLLHKGGAPNNSDVVRACGVACRFIVVGVGTPVIDEG